MSQKMIILEESEIGKFCKAGIAIKKENKISPLPFEEDERQQLFFGNPLYEHVLKRFILLQKDNKIVARLAAFIPDHDPTTGITGFFDTLDTTDVAGLFACAHTWLADNGCRKVKGPINLSLWMGYRLSEGHTNAWFAGEPVNPSFYNDAYLSVGYKICDTWFSHRLSREQAGKIVQKFKPQNIFAGELGYDFILFDKKRKNYYLDSIWKIMMKAYQYLPSFHTLDNNSFNYFFSDADKIIDNKSTGFIVGEKNEIICLLLVYKDVVPALTAMHGKKNILAKLMALLKFRHNHHPCIAHGAAIPEAIKKANDAGMAKKGKPVSLGRALTCFCLEQILKNKKYKDITLGMMHQQASTLAYTWKRFTHERKYFLYQRTL